MTLDELPPRTTKALFVGPSDADLVSVAQGPGLVVKMDSKPGSEGFLRTLALGDGFREDTGHCTADFWSMESTSAASYLGNYAKLTDSEVAGLADGALVGIEVDVVCAAQGDN